MHNSGVEKGTTGLRPHADRGSQYLPIRYIECLVEQGIDLFAGGVGDRYDTVLAERVIGLFTAEMINLRKLDI